jgi:hypothetical protein
MHRDLEQLIRLQALESERDAARKAIDAMPGRREAIEARLAEREAAVASAKQRLADNQVGRRAIEKDLAVVQGRLAKFKDQLMEVKTNKEYTAMQHEIATATAEVRRFEDALLERMVEADELASSLKSEERELAAAKAETAKELAALEIERATIERSLEDAGSQRDALAAEMNPDLLAQFEQVRVKRGTAVVEARDGHCTVCHVRLRPQVYNQIRLNAEIFKCDSCGRVLYYVPPASPPPAPPSA